MATKPKWCLKMLRTRRRTFGNLVGHVDGVSDMTSLLAWIEQQFDPRVSWDDIAWIRRLWDKKLVLKGIMDAEDARHAIDAGADAIVVSNHGGRQLDGAPSSIRALPAIVKAVDGRTEVWFDGGIRSGQDVLKAIALGAKATMIGRAFVYGLGAMGEAGVRLCLEIIAKELSVTMGFCGVVDINAVNSGILIAPTPVAEAQWL
jgi:L-lactate dehydrogenase (cytochrome)